MKTTSHLNMLTSITLIFIRFMSNYVFWLRFAFI
jgi:hypothetical protein